MLRTRYLVPGTMYYNCPYSRMFRNSSGIIGFLRTYYVKFRQHQKAVTKDEEEEEVVSSTVVVISDKRAVSKIDSWSTTVTHHSLD